MKKHLLPVLLVLMACTSGAQDKMDFEKYEPTSTLVVPEHKLTRAKFPFIDVHNHQFDMPTQNLGALVTDMNKLNMAVMVNLSGQSGSVLKQSLTNVKEHAPNRFIVFANIDFDGIGDKDWTAK